MKKLAMLVGNDRYKIHPLKNAVNDANTLSKTLESLGFECVCLNNIGILELTDELQEFGRRLNVADVGLFFFAGHGFQIDGKNLLASIDIDFDSDSEIAMKKKSTELVDVIATINSSSVAVKIVILDACRSSLAFGRGITNTGIASVSAPKGCIIAFSTSPGQDAKDGESNHGVYTGALLKHITEKGTSVEDMFKQVRRSVSVSTDDEQITWEHTSLVGHFSFNPEDEESLTSSSTQGIDDSSEDTKRSNSSAD